ncbi:Putative LOC100877791, partial [Caligus rogercresseyi]
GNPYHNGVHATDVTQAMNLFLQEPLIKGSLSPLELMSALIAAASHDLDHPGSTKSSSLGHRVTWRHSTTSQSAGPSWRTTTGALPSPACTKSDSQAPSPLRTTQSSATSSRALFWPQTSQAGGIPEEALQGDRRRDFQAPLDKDSRSFIVQIAMKCADISNPCRTWHISKLWSHRASEEFFRQGDKERGA